LNPGSPTPQAGILNQSSRPTTSILYSEGESVAIRRPHEETRFKEQIDKTIAKTIIEGKAQNTIKSFRHRLNQLGKAADLMNPDDVKTAIAYAKLSNSSKTSFVLAYEWFTKANGLTWQKPRYKWTLGIPIIPTTNQVEKIISATTKRFATIFKLMAETGVEGEELHQTHRKQCDQTQYIISIKGLKGHGSATYKLKTPTAEMLNEYLARNPQEYPFPRPIIMSEMWRRARNIASQNHNDPNLRKIPMKNLRNYSGAQMYFKSANSPIAAMRHLRHKRLETTMHYLRAINLDEEPDYDTQIAQNKDDLIKLNNAGYTYIQTVEGIGHIYRKRK
jgi:integrase